MGKISIEFITVYGEGTCIRTMPTYVLSFISPRKKQCQRSNKNRICHWNSERVPLLGVWAGIVSHCFQCCIRPIDKQMYPSLRIQAEQEVHLEKRLAPLEKLCSNVLCPLSWKEERQAEEKWGNTYDIRVPGLTIECARTGTDSSGKSLECT